jgi:hypothetical protein
MNKYKLNQILAPLLLVLLPFTAVAAEVGGVKLPDTVRITDAGPELVLNGAGLRTRLMFRVYAGALYLPKKSAVASAIINDAGAKRVMMHMLRDVPADQFADALEDGLKNNNAAEELAKLEAQVKQLRAVFDAVKVAKSGDVILIDYLPGSVSGSSTRVTINGSVKTTIAGEEFNRALLRVWLGDKPADNDLKKGMLGS